MLRVTSNPNTTLSLHGHTLSVFILDFFKIHIISVNGFFDVFPFRFNFKVSFLKTLFT